MRIRCSFRKIDDVRIVNKAYRAVQIRNGVIKDLVREALILCILKIIEKRIHVSRYIRKQRPVERLYPVFVNESADHILRGDDNIVCIIKVRIHCLVCLESSVDYPVLRISSLEFCYRILCDVLTPVINDEFLSAVAGRERRHREQRR